jgi:hypothetical protein
MKLLLTLPSCRIWQEGKTWLLKTLQIRVCYCTRAMLGQGQNVKSHVTVSYLQRCPDDPTALKLYSQAEEKLQNAASFSTTDVAPRVTLGDALSGHGERLHAGEKVRELSIPGARGRMFLTWMEKQVNQKEIVVKCKMSVLKWAPGYLRDFFRWGGLPSWRPRPMK